MFLRISVSSLTHCMMRGIKVPAFQTGTGSKRLSLVARSQFSKIYFSCTILPHFFFLLENKLSSISTICLRSPIWTVLFMKCERTMSLQYWFQSTVESSPDLQFMLGVCHGHSPFLFHHR